MYDYRSFIIVLMEKGIRTYLLEHAGVTEEQFALLSEKLMYRTFQKGQFLLSRGEVCKHSFFIEKGLARFYSVDRQGKEHIIQFAPENWFLSDRGSFWFNEPSDYFIDAIEETTVVVFDEAFINYASEISPLFRKYNERILHNHIRNLQNRINLLIGASAEERYMDFIKLYPDLMLRVPQWMIASFLGITPESLSRVRKDLAGRWKKD